MFTAVKWVTLKSAESHEFDMPIVEKRNRWTSPEIGILKFLKEWIEI